MKTIFTDKLKEDFWLICERLYWYIINLSNIPLFHFQQVLYY